MRFATFLYASALTALASAQTATTTSSGSATVTSPATTTTTASSGEVASTQSQLMPAIATQGFNPTNVTLTTRQNWCRAQRNSCPAICGGGFDENRCEETTLTYQCVCSNGTTPDCTRYTQTLPFYICQATRDQCVANHPDDRTGQETCMANAQCGSIDPPGIEAAVTSSATISSGSNPSSTSGAGGSSATTTTSSRNAAMLYNAEIGTGAFAGILMAALQFLL